MKSLLLQKLPLTGDTSFVARTFRTPEFEVSWHQHPEIELILFTEGAGQFFIGNAIGAFETGDIFLLGPHLPHTFQRSGTTVASAVVVQFKKDFWGEPFLQLPEMKPIQQLLETALRGLQITGIAKEKLASPIRDLEHLKGAGRVLSLGACLQIISETQEWLELSTQEIRTWNSQELERLERVFQYSFDNFKEPITLKTVAGLAALSIPAFCMYFKKRTKKTYIDFLNELRISHACKQLTDTNAGIEEICYECGFNTLTHFHRQFRKLKGRTPLQYRVSMQKY